MVTTTTENAGNKVTGFGSYLKATRETLRMSEKEAAARLHLNPKIIAIIESEHFENGPPMIFMRGYLRSYARLLNISNDEITAALSQLETTNPAAAATPQRKMPPRQSSGSSLTRWVTYLIAVLLITQVAVWWRNTHSTNNSPIKSTLVTPAETISPNVAPTAPVAANSAVQPVNTPTPAQQAVSNAPVELNVLPEVSEVGPQASNHAAPALQAAKAEPAAAKNTNVQVAKNTAPAPLVAPETNTIEPTTQPGSEKSVKTTLSQAAASITQTLTSAFSSSTKPEAGAEVASAPKTETPAEQPVVAAQADTPKAKAPAHKAAPAESTHAVVEASQENDEAPVAVAEETNAHISEQPENQMDLAQAKMDLPEPGLDSSDSDTQIDENN